MIMMKLLIFIHLNNYHQPLSIIQLRMEKNVKFAEILYLIEI